MTPEERFERIEKTLDRMASTAAAAAERSQLHDFAIDERMTRLERSQEFLMESHKQLAENLAKLTSNVSRVETTVSRLETNLELLQDFMSQSAQRVEAHLGRMADAIRDLARLFERHTRDGHGGNGGGGER